MAVSNREVARTFARVADLLEVRGANRFRVQAYRNAARVLEDHPRRVERLVEAGEDLTKIKGIGPDLAQKIDRVVHGEGPRVVAEAAQGLSPGLVDLLRLPGLGPKRVQALGHALGIQDVEGLRKAAEAGQVRELPGFGELTERRLLAALASWSERRWPLAEALRASARLLADLGDADAAGSLRRGKDTVGDLDLVATSPEVMERLVEHPDVQEVLARGATRATVRLRGGMHVDLRIVAPESRGAALCYFTGSKAHNIALRRRALQRGMRLNEYGLHRDGEHVAGAGEEDVYGALGLPWIDPALREDQGEIEAADVGELPDLVELCDLRGDLHSHTRATDGRDTLEAMAEAAAARGLEYLAVTDHTKRLTVAKGLDDEAMLAHLGRIEAHNDEAPLRLLKGAEVDIHKDGSLDLAHATLEAMDVVVASVHSSFGLDERQQTKRLVRAARHPLVDVLGHPLARRIGRREAIRFDVDAVLAACAENGTALEVNAQPERMDAPGPLCRRAKMAGVKLALSTDAHSTRDLANMHLAVTQARRGWIEKDDVLNTRSWKGLLGMLKRGK